MAVTPVSECDSAEVSSADCDRDIADPPCELANPKELPTELTT